MPIMSEDGKEYANDAMYALGVAEPIEKGNIDLNNRPQVQTPDGVATVRSMSFERDGREILIPTVAGDGSRILSNEEAIKQYDETGQHLGIYPDVATAEAYGERIHLDQEQMYSSPFDAAAARTKASVKPLEGRTEGKITQTMESIPEKVLASTANFLKGPANAMAPNPYKEGSEEYDYFETLRKQNTYQWAGEAAVNMFGVGAATIPMRPGLGTFGGMAAAKADWYSATKAMNMAKEGKTPYEIFDATGWYKGHEGEWKFEIPDTKGQINPAILNDAPKEGKPGWDAVHTGTGDKVLPKEGEFKLSTFFEHEKLYKNYPEFKDIKVKIESGIDRAGAMDAQNGVLYLNNSLDPKTARSVVLHELQHAIQHKEGFAKGAAYASPEEIRTGWEARLKDLQYVYENPRTFAQSYSKDELREIFDIYTKAQSIQNEMQAVGSKLSRNNYRRTAGEVEARNVQFRAGLNDSERSLTPPSFTEDTIPGKQIVSQEVQYYRPYGKDDLGKD